MVLFLYSSRSFPDSLLLDHETKERIDSVSATFSNNLSLMNEKHGEDTESLRNVTSNCLEKNYKVNFSCLQAVFFFLNLYSVYLLSESF
jgi:hypothetical protein